MNQTLNCTIKVTNQLVTSICDPTPNPSLASSSSPSSLLSSSFDDTMLSDAEINPSSTPTILAPLFDRFSINLIGNVSITSPDATFLSSSSSSSLSSSSSSSADQYSNFITPNYGNDNNLTNISLAPILNFFQATKLLPNLTTPSSADLFLSDEALNDHSFVSADYVFEAADHTLGSANRSSDDAIYWSASDVSIALILWIIVGVSTIGNALVMFAIFKDRNLQSAQNYLIASLATADEMVSLFVMPPAAIMEIRGKWTLGNLACYAWTSADVCSCTSSILHLVAIAFDRYWSVSDVNYSVNRSFAKIKFSLFAIWILSLILCLIPLFGWKDPDFDDRILRDECMISQDPKYQITATTATFWIPTIVILVVYYMIFQVRWRQFHYPPSCFSFYLS